MKNPTEKSIDWRGSALKDLQAFPDDAKHKAGFQLRKVQKSERPDDFKPMPDIGAGVNEIIVDVVTPADGNVFADLGFAPDQAKVMLMEADASIAQSQKLKQEAANAIAHWMKSEKLTQLAAAEILEVSRPRISDLVNAKLSRFSLDTLVAMLCRTGKNVELVVR